MTARFQKLFEERGSDPGAINTERRRLERARSRAELRQISAAFAVAYTLAALFPLAGGSAARPAIPGKIDRHLDCLCSGGVCLDDRLDHRTTYEVCLGGDPTDTADRCSHHGAPTFWE